MMELLVNHDAWAFIKGGRPIERQAFGMHTMIAR